MGLDINYLLFFSIIICIDMIFCIDKIFRNFFLLLNQLKVKKMTQSILQDKFDSIALKISYIGNSNIALIKFQVCLIICF
jgi:hypothetical protein